MTPRLRPPSKTNMAAPAGRLAAPTGAPGRTGGAPPFGGDARPSPSAGVMPPAPVADAGLPPTGWEASVTALLLLL